MLWTAIEEMSALYLQEDGTLKAALSEAGDPRALRAPDRVRTYTIKQSDTLTKIAEAGMVKKNVRYWELKSGIATSKIGAQFCHSS